MSSFALEFPPPEKYKNPNSPFYKFRHLSAIERIHSLHSIFSFHSYVEKKNYVAIDFMTVVFYIILIQTRQKFVI